MSLPSLSGGTWNYDFTTQDIGGSYWSTVHSNDGVAPFTFTFSSGNGQIIAAPSGGTGMQSGYLSLDLTQFPALTGDFSLSATFKGATFPANPIHQVQVFAVFQSSNAVVDVRSNEMTGVNVWQRYSGSGSVAYTLGGITSDQGTTNAAIFGISRVGDTITTYWNGSAFWNTTGYSNDPLAAIYLMSQKNGLTDAVQVTYQSFSLTASAIPEPSTYAALAGLGVLGFAACRGRQRRAS